jgi:hypothetical protein
MREQIDRYIGDQPPAKSAELRDLHRRILAISPDAKLWFLDGRNDDGKVVSNPNIGYGSETLSYATGDTRAFYKIGLSANTSGISVYVMGLKDKRYLLETYGSRLGKAKISGYCIRFKSVKDVDLGVLEEVVADAMGPGSAGASLVMGSPDALNVLRSSQPPQQGDQRRTLFFIQRPKRFVRDL